MSKTDWNREAPLLRVKGESQRANDALKDYYAMGSGRSLRKLHDFYSQQASDETSMERPPTTKWTTLSKWSAMFDWVERVREQQAIQEAEDEARWAERRLVIRERDWRQSEELRQVGDKILAEAPMFLRRQHKFVPGQGGEPDREVITLALNGQLAIKAIELGSKLARLSAEMESDRQKMVIALEKEIDGILAIAEQVLDDDNYQRLLAAITGLSSGETPPTNN